jgi:hypothetical protein
MIFNGKCLSAVEVSERELRESGFERNREPGWKMEWERMMLVL